jgi:hypothetical protein
LRIERSRMFDATVVVMLQSPVLVCKIDSLDIVLKVRMRLLATLHSLL